MKTTYCRIAQFLALAFFLFLLPARCQAEEPLWFPPLGTPNPVPYSVEATNGLKLGVMGGRHIATTNIDYNELFLVFRLPEKYIPKGVDRNGKPLGDYGLVYEPKPEYFARLTLYDSNSNAVPKTTLGANYRLKDIPAWDYKYTVPYQPNSRNNSPIPIFAKDSWSQGFIELPKVSQMFEIKKPGAYRLMLEAQVFAWIGTNKTVVHFPPLEIPVIRPEDIAPTNSLPK